MSRKQRKRNLNKRRNRARALNRGILTYNGIMKEDEEESKGLTAPIL